MTEYVNKDYYKSLAVADRFYINPGNMTRPFMDRLNAEGIPFSATLGDYKQTVTVSRANRERAEGILYSLNAVQEAQPPQYRRNNNIIGNTEYNSITDKRYIKTDADTARNIEQSLKNSGNILFSGIIRGNTATITVSGDENAAAIRSMIDNMKYGTLLADLAAAGFDRVTNDSFFKEGFIVLRNRATGEQCGFDGFDMIRSMWEDPENEYFHPPIYKIVRDSEKLDYYISERYPDSDIEKDVYYERNGNVPTFDSIDEAVRYVQRNNIAVTNTAEEFNDLRVDEITRREQELEKSNTKLIAQFPHNNDMYPDDFMFYPENGKYDWIYFNPDGDGGRGVFNYSRMTEDDIYNAYKAYKDEDDADKARQAFFSYLYNYANTEIINTRNEEFRGYANGYIRKPTMAERYYGLLEKGGDTVEIDRFIHINELRNKYITADYDRSNGVFLEDIDLRTANAEQRNAYRRSMESNIRCAEAVSEAIHNYYGFRSENVLDTETALADVMGRFTPERVAYVLAVTINDRGEFDKRISGSNNEWAKSLLANVPDLYTSVSNRSVLSIRSQLGETHTGLINLLVDEFEKQYRDISLTHDDIISDVEENISDKVSREYKEYLENIRKESVDVIIQSANEIAEKEKISRYFEDNFDENSFWEKDLEVLRNATHLLEDVYEVWADSPNLSSVDDVRIAITTAIEYNKIRYEKPAAEEIKQEEPQIPLAEQVVQRLQDEMAKFNDEMLKNDPSAILSRITEISAKREIAEYDVIGDYNLDTNRLTALLTSKNILDEVYQEWLSLDTNGLQDIGLAFEECADAIMESMKREHAETIEPEMQEDTIEPEIIETVVPEQPETAVEEPIHDKHYYFELAQKYINEFCDREYGSTADFSNINEVGIGYTTVTDDEIELQVNADLENNQIKYYLDKRLYKTEDYDSLQELTENALSALDFNELAYEVEKDGDEAILAVVNVDTMITVPEHGISFDIAKVDEFVIEGSYSEYIGGMDENGHEAKDNYQQYDTSLSLRLEGAKVISEIYDERDMFSPYTEDVFDLLEDGGREALTDHINGYISDNDVNKIYTIKNGTKEPLELHESEKADDVVKTEPPFGIKNDHQAIVAAPPGSLDCILRNGCNDEHSLERIAAHFMKDKNNTENAEFLAKEFGIGGRGYIIGDDTVAAWFGKEGITFAEGDTAFPVGFNSFVPWEDAAARLRMLLENGQYCSQEILDAAPEYEITQIAETIWYLHQDLEEDVEFFLENEYFSSGFPNDTEKLASELHDPEFCKKIAEGLSEFAERYAADSEILRFHYHKPDEILSRVQDLLKSHKEFTAQPDIQNDTKFFITEDEKDQIIMEGSSISDGKYRINAFFSDEHGEKAQIEFLKAEYGTGGTGRTGFSEWHDAKGIGVQKKAANGEICEYTFKWNEVARRISRLVSESIYFTEKDAADHERHLEWEKEHDSETVSAPVFRPTFEIYQVKEGSEYRDVRFASMDELEHFGHKVDKANYDHVYTGALSSIESPDKLPGIVEKFNIGDIPSDYNGRSISMGDVIVINTEACSTAHYIDRIGYKDVSDIFIEPVRQQKQETAEENVETPEEKPGIAVTAAEAMIMWQAGIAVHNENGALPAYSLAVKTDEMFTEDHTFSVSIQENDLFRIADKIASDMQAISDEHHGDNFDLPNMHKAIKWADWNDNANVYENTIASLFKEDYYGITAYTVNIMGFSDDEEQGQKAKEALELIEDFKTAFGKVTLIAPVIVDEPAPVRDNEPKQEKEPAETINTESEGLHIDGYTDTWSVINNMAYGGKELYLLENDEVGDETPYLIVDSDMNVLFDEGYSFDDFTANYSESDVAGGLIHGYLSDIVKDMGLMRTNISFAVVTFNDEKTVIMDSVPDENDIYDTEEYREYVEESGSNEVEVSYEYYSLGAEVESTYATEEQKKYIRDNLDDVTAEATELESSSFTVTVEHVKDNIRDDLDIGDSSISYTVVTFDGEHTFITSDYPDEESIYDMPEYQDYVRDHSRTSVDVVFQQYSIGEGVNTPISEEQLGYIRGHIDAVKAESELIKAHSFTTENREEEIDIPSDYDEPEVSEDNDDISEDIEEQEPITEKKPTIAAAELAIGDIFFLRGKEYTITGMQGIHADDVVITKTESMNGRNYDVTENFDKFRLIREGEYRGNPIKEAQKQAEYTPRIGDLIELDGINLYAVEDISGDEITFREMDTLFADTLKMPLSDLYTHDFKVINENDLYKYEEPEYDIFGDPIRRAPEDSKETAQPVFEHTAEKLDEPDMESAAETPVQAETQVSKGTNFVITDEHFGEAGGEKSRYADNVAAIRTLKLIESEERTATPEEQKTLSKYTGWGAISQVFNSNNEKWSKEYEELRGLLTDAEYTAARKSTMNAHYTSPTVINAIYAGLEKLGFESGRILEPAMGIGNFFGRLPETMANSRLTGVELDSLTGRIAKQLYPNANIQIKGFEETGFSDNSFDVAVGNVPFGDYKLHDRRYDDNNFFIHDFFFAKALDKVRPGGIVAFVTSKGTLDKENSKVREYIAQRAELLGAIRLPNNAFKANAGTEVTSDIIFLQKRERPIMIDPESISWLHKAENSDGLSINSYFVEHPEMVLGKIVEGNKLYGDQTKETSCEPIRGAVLSEQLAEAIKHIEGQYIPADITQDVKIADEVPAPPDSRKYSFYAVNGELYYRQEGDTMTRFKAKSDIEKRALGMIAVRDTMHELLDLQLNNADGTLDGEIADKRAQLNEIYAEFTKKYGYISDPKNEKAFKGDDGYHLISGLEIKDEKSGTIHKADIFTKNTVKPKIIATHVDSAQEALILSVSEKAKVDFDYMTELTGMDKEKLISELQGQIFRLPQQEEVYVTADEYLTGNIRKKIEALSYAPADMDVSEHRKALEAAMPPRLEAKDISVRLGAHWVDPMYIQQFILEKFHPDYKTRTEMQVQYSKTAGTWKIEGVSQTAKKNYTATDTYGTKRMHAYAILEGILNNSSLQVKDHKLDENGMEIRDDKGNYVLVVNEEETKAVNIVAKAIKAEFEDWIFKDPVRREALVDKYNEIYNSIRQREYDGSHLNFVGMNADIILRDHQKNAIARALYGGNTLLAHCVGAGKTYEMIAIAMEGKRLGQHNKTLFAVPNALTEQIGQDFLRLYPGANILVATKKDFETKNRKNLLARIAANDYDAVIVGHSQFDRMGLSAERQKTYLQAEIDLLRDELEAAIDENGDRSFTVKQIEKSISSYEDRLKKLDDKQEKDDFIDFEQLGFDHICLDESQNYKNLATATKMHNVAGLGSRGSARAFNLLMKAKYLDEMTGGRGLTFASGTPISNSMTELYTLMRYLQAGLLKDVGIQHFDEWAADFGEVVTDFELKPESDGQYQLKTRFAKFMNLPELMSMFKECADIKTSDTLPLDRPEKDVKEVVAEPSKIQRKAIKSLGKRASKIRSGSVDPREDNMLKITADGRKIGLDQRLLDPSLPDDPHSKVNMCVRNVFDIYEQTKAQRSTQLIFCDLSTPKPESRQDCFYVYRKNVAKPLGYEMIRKKVGIKADFGFDEVKKHIKENAQEESDKLRNGDIVVIRRPSEDMESIVSQAAVYTDGVLIPDNTRLEDLEMSEIQDMPPKGFNVYDDIKDKLIVKGVPEDEIAFIHDYDTAEKKQKLFDKMNAGEIRVLLGSTSKCGAGMNAQRKMIALHHLDCPMRPSDMEQRDGRIWRQGNENKQVQIYRYVTDKSFDSYLYQMLENKQRFISQVMTSKTPERTCSDIDEQALDYAEVKALCAGNPLIRKEMDLQGKIKDLKMEKSRYSERIYELQDNIRVKYPMQIKMLEGNIEKSKVDFSTANDHAGELRLGGTTFDMNDPDSRKAGAEALKAAITDPKNCAEAMSKELHIGEYRGMQLSMMFDDLTKIWKGCLEGQKHHYFDFNTNTDVGNITRMDNCISNIAKEVASSQEKLETLSAELVQMQADVEKPFAKTEELRSMEAELDDVHMQLTKFTLTDDTAQKEMFERLVEMFTPILTGEIGYQKYTAEGDSMEPFIVEMEGDVLTLAHTYVQNGDLMWDPRIDFKIDYEDRKATPISYGMSSLGVYEEYDIENPTPQLMEKINEMLEYTDGWLDNVEDKDYEPIDKEQQIQNKATGMTI